MTADHESPAPDLDACEREPLPFSGQIQDVGALLATAAGDDVIAHSSTNLERWFDGTAAGARQRLDDFFRDDCSYFIHRRRRIFEDQHFVIRGVVTNRGIEGDLLLCESGAHRIYEFEPRPAQAPAHSASGNPPSVTVDALSLPGAVPVEAALRRSHAITGYPKIMLYRFLDDGAGEVVAELSDQQLDTYQGLRFPASDIPRIARNLYIDNPFRLIFDTQGATVALRAHAADDAVIDLSRSTLRSVSPVHIEYLGNMGVRSSASFPVRVLGKLWGLLAMHSPTPRSIPIDERLQVVQVVEQELARRIMDTRLRENHRRFNANVELLERSAASIVGLLRDPTPVEAVPEPVRTLLTCDAVILRVDGRRITPAAGFRDAELDALADLGAREGTRNHFLSDCLHQHLAQDEDFRRRASGLFYATVTAPGTGARLEILWIREEQAGTVTWAGRPEKLSAIVDGEERISPRKSFAAWSGETRGRSAPWSSGDQLLVSKLLVQILARARGAEDRPEPP